MAKTVTDSYGAKIKAALCEKTSQAFGFTQGGEQEADDCCRLSFFAGLLIFGCKAREDQIRFSVKNESLADLFASMAAAFYSLSPKVEQNTLSLPVDAAFGRVLQAADLSLSDGRITPLPIPVCGRCQGYFLRAVFLCCGAVSSPDKKHQLNLFSGEASDELRRFLQDADLNFGASSRRGHSYLYLKKTSSIEDFLTRIGAQVFSMQLMNQEIERSVRADINRKNNFDTANISRSSLFLSKLSEAISVLEERGAVDSLPEGLKVIVRIQKAHPEDTLSELGARIHPPLSKSGLYHRAKKIIDLADHKEV